VHLGHMPLALRRRRSRLYKVGQIPYKELDLNRTANLGTKEEVKFSCPRHEGTHRGAEVQLQSLLSSALHRASGQLHALAALPPPPPPPPQTPSENFPVRTELENKWPLESVGRFLKRQKSCSCRDSNPGSSSANLR
jgi:hypothetical protein